MIFLLKNLILQWKWVGGSRSHSEFFLENRPKTVLYQLVLTFRDSLPCVFWVCIHMLLNVVSQYDSSVLSMSVMFFQKTFGRLVPNGGWGEISIFVAFL